MSSRLPTSRSTERAEACSGHAPSRCRRFSDQIMPTWSDALAPQRTLGRRIKNAVTHRVFDAAALQADVAQHLVVECLDLAQRASHLDLEQNFVDQPA